MPHIDSKDFHWFMGVKFALTLYLFKTCSFAVAFGAYVGFFLVYRYLIAALLGLKVMTMGDYGTFCTNDKAHTNIMTGLPVSEANPEYARELFMRMVKAHIKARSCIVSVLGDLYYKELEMQSVMDSQF